MKEESILKNEWCKHFNLSAYTSTKFYRIVGCFIVGFEMIKIPNRGLIHPHLVVYPLWRDDIKLCMKHPYMMYGLLNKKNLQVQLPICELLQTKNEIFKDIEEFIGFSINTDVIGSDMYSLVNRCLPHQINDPWRLMDVNESNIILSAYMNDRKMYDKAVSSLDAAFIHISPHLNMIEQFYGKYEDWKNNLLSSFYNRDEILARIEKNMANCKIQSRSVLLPRSE